MNDLILGTSIYLPPIFKAFLLGTIAWLIIHYLIRDWMYSGEVWHPNLMDVSLFILSISGALFILRAYNV